MPESNKKCPYCYATMKKYWHPLSPGLVRTLVKIYAAVSAKEENRVHPHKEMKLTTTEHMNMTKLRFHGLIARFKVDGEAKRGQWLITRRGAAFLRGEIQIPKKVQTFRNRVVERSEDHVTVKDVMSSLPYWHETFEYDIFAPKQQPLIN